MYKEQILNELKKYHFEQRDGVIFKTFVWNDVYTNNVLKTSEISKNKAFVSAHSLGLKDEILLAFQNGISEKDSFIITEELFSAAQTNWFSKNIVTKFYWKNIENIAQINHTLVVSLKNGEEQSLEIDKIFTKNKDRAVELVKMLQNILRITQGKYKAMTDVKKIKSNRYLIIGIAAIFVIIFMLILESLNNDTESPREISNFKENNTNEEILLPVNKVVYDTIWSDKPQKDFNIEIKYKNVNVFQEPYQLTMQVEGWFSGVKKKIIIPVNIPLNTKHWVYRIILSNARIESGETQSLVKEVSSKTKTIYVDGKEKEKIVETESSFLRELIGGINAPSKQKPFLDIYFIDNEKDAKNFTENKEYNYDIKNSIKNTHSRNGLVEFNENKYIFLGLENLGYKDDIYVSLEVVALIENIRYYKVIEKEVE
ncbi:MAG: hypothetical protein Q4A09_00875 [Capnocytophaga felis]|nr:hypothetical protein [Capnocytophaga felis]